MSSTKTSQHLAGARVTKAAARISDVKLDALIDAMKSEMDGAKRDALIRDALLSCGPGR